LKFNEEQDYRFSFGSLLFLSSSSENTKHTKFKKGNRLGSDIERRIKHELKVNLQDFLPQARGENVGNQKGETNSENDKEKEEKKDFFTFETNKTGIFFSSIFVKKRTKSQYCQ
jgi:hypothetical protein